MMGMSFFVGAYIRPMLVVDYSDDDEII